MTIERAFPDIRSTDLPASKSFYTEVLGFDLSMEERNFLLFSSPSNPKVQVSVNGDFGKLPPGFSVDVGNAEQVTAIHAEAIARGIRIVEELENKPWGIRRFSLLDPSGQRVTVLAHFRVGGPS